MKKLTIFILLMMILSSFTVFAAETDSNTSIKVYIDNGEAQATELTDTAYRDSNGNIMIPLRATMEAFNYKVEWIQETKSIVISNTAIEQIPTLTMQINKNIVTYNDRTENMSGNATIKDDKTYIPLNSLEILRHSTTLCESPESTEITIFEVNKLNEK